MAFNNATHARQYRDGFRRMAKEEGLTRHVTLTVKPLTAHGRSIKTAKFAAKVAFDLAWEACSHVVYGYGEQIEGGAPHVHLLTTRKDARAIKDAWQAAGLGHVKVKSADGDALAFGHMVDYVAKKALNDPHCRGDLIWVPTIRDRSA